MQVSVYSQSGKKLERKVTLDKKVFGQEVNVPLVAQAVRVFQQNQRMGTASTKDRSEVSGGGVKPRRNKYPGMARIGSRTSPLHWHGGVVHGPKPKDYGLKFPEKMKKQALYMALSDMAKEDKLYIVSKIDVKERLTHTLAQIIGNLPVGKKVLLVTNGESANLLLASRNLKHITVRDVKNLHAYDVLASSDVVILEKVLEQL